MSAETESYAELEIGLSRAAGGTLQVELRFTDPESETEIPPARGATSLDAESLLEHQLDAEAYGHALAARLFGDTETELRKHYRQVKTAIEARGKHLRLRLRLDAPASDLQAVRWELLRDPDTGEPLATSEKMLFSRFMSSRDWRPVRLRRKRELSALIAVSSPSDLEKYRLAAIDREGEIGRARTALEGARVRVADQPLTLDSLVSHLRKGVDVLYLSCHGALLPKAREPVLYLQAPAGAADAIHGSELADRVRELTNPPALVFLASCESAGTERGTDALGRATAQASLAPLLAEAGVPAIVAMQGKISMATVEQMVPEFFQALMEDGQIDRALAVARGLVRGQFDAWMPALYTRLKSGRLWYVPGFAGEDQFTKWKPICRRARQGKLIPILGPDFGEHVCGSSRDLAQRLAEEHHFPMARHERRDLAKVTQYLAIDQDRDYVEEQVFKHFGELLAGHQEELVAAGNDPGDSRFLDRVVEHHLQDEGDPYRILADLDSEVFVTAGAETLLLKSLEQRGKCPEPLFCRWRSTEKEHPVPPERQQDGPPTGGRPVVYHVFGSFQDWSSLVLTEDEFFDYLIATSKYDLMPEVFAGSLTEGSLVFLGFQLDDWRFRVLFRQIMALGGRGDLKRRTHVGVQVKPDDQSVADVRQACRYLEDYFAADRGVGEPKIDIYWGSAADFLRELRRRLEQAEDEGEPVVPPAAGWF